MNTNHAQLHIQSPALTSTAIFWVFILLSLLAHGVFLMINSGTSPAISPLAQNKPTLEITLQPATQAQPALAPRESQADKKLSAKTVTPSTLASVKPAPAHSTEAQIAAQKPQTPSVNAVLLRQQALQWLQQQANSKFDDSAHLRQLVSYGAQHRSDDSSMSAYRSQDGSVRVAFQLGNSSICAVAREANPLDSFDQGVWMVDPNCRG